jgi:glycosyltransferase involved in cell wall biosynthesis
VPDENATALKILISSHHFRPSIGGIETVSELLAHEFVRLGHDVRLVTQTPGETKSSAKVVRCPGPAELLRHVAWCDVFWQNNISLRALWPAALVRRPIFITYQTWVGNPLGDIDSTARFKLFFARFGRSVAISHAIAQQLPFESVVISNPYDDEVFWNFNWPERDRDLVCVGRLVSDKGVDLFVDALSILRESGIETQVTIIGDGPERPALEARVRDLKLQAHVEFVGSQRPSELATALNRHRILVVPSRWPEPFGIVALEGIACGCAVVGSAQGGLPEAIGPCGVTFPNNDTRALAEGLAELITNRERQRALLAHADSHLDRFTKRTVANAYLELFESAR